MKRQFTALAMLAVLIVPLRAFAQAWAYPSFQTPRIAVREYNFGVGDADSRGITLVFQWREQSGPRTQFSFDVGIADTDDRDTDLVAFGGLVGAMRLGSATAEVPLDFLLTGGVYVAVGGGTYFRLPVGVSIGHRFDFDGSLALTPYMHPRVSVDMCSNCGGRDNLGLTFDLGMNLEVTRTLSVRGAALFSGSDSFDGEGFGISFAWTPPSLARESTGGRR